ncbi:MAG: antibiotic biosynthesis monooxygenase [Myxococcales bacterium]|nr:antibiotic biosynthesis monooxygenase [Myxococcales bacterium]
MRVCTINRCRAESGSPEELREIFASYSEDLRRNEPGCLALHVMQDSEDPAEFVVFAEFADQAAYEAHLASAHVARLRGVLHPRIGDSHRKTILHPIA